MKKTSSKHLSEQDIQTLHDTIYYLTVGELKESCRLLDISDAGTKGHLVTKIMSLVTTGTAVQDPVIPAISRAKSHPPQPLAPGALMLYGSYKNDLKTRTFFKTLIGPHFHYTAFGIDWLNERWLQGKPPTYQEFADYWTKETNARKVHKAPLKQEWQYLNFVQHAQQTMPHASKSEVMKAWKMLRSEKALQAIQPILIHAFRLGKLRRTGH